MKSGNNMSFSFCEDEKWKYDANDKQGNLRRFWGYGKTKIPSRRPVTETNLSEPDASATVIKLKKRPDPFFPLIKGSYGGVAVGLPHRNSSVFKQTHIN